jgi:hypothetical protein
MSHHKNSRSDLLQLTPAVPTYADLRSPPLLHSGLLLVEDLHRVVLHTSPRRREEGVRGPLLANRDDPPHHHLRRGQDRIHRIRKKHLRPPLDHMQDLQLALLHRASGDAHALSQLNQSPSSILCNTQRIRLSLVVLHNCSILLSSTRGTSIDAMPSTIGISRQMSLYSCQTLGHDSR